MPSSCLISVKGSLELNENYDDLPRGKTEAFSMSTTGIVMAREIFYSDNNNDNFCWLEETEVTSLPPQDLLMSKFIIFSLY